MENKIICTNPVCRAQLKRPNAPFVKCPNCKNNFFVFCHQFPYILNQHMRCDQCPTELYYFFCFKCQGLLCFKDYRMGSVTRCKCGFKGCYVICNNCKNSQCFPPEQRYQGLNWKCNACKSSYSFVTCDRCFHQIYSEQFQRQQIIKCKNVVCTVDLTIKNCQSCTFIFADSRNKSKCLPCQLNKSDSIDIQFKVQKNDQSKKKNIPKNQENQQSLCKVCLDKQAIYLNTTCFHLSLCQVCVAAIKTQCPICRAEGTFRKIFK